LLDANIGWSVVLDKGLIGLELHSVFRSGSIMDWIKKRTWPSIFKKIHFDIVPLWQPMTIQQI
jgi:hypothetical protein